jgi:hypothetical protein
MRPATLQHILQLWISTDAPALGAACSALPSCRQRKCEIPPDGLMPLERGPMSESRTLVDAGGGSLSSTGRPREATDAFVASLPAAVRPQAVGDASSYCRCQSQRVQ